MVHMMVWHRNIIYIHEIHMDLYQIFSAQDVESTLWKKKVLVFDKNKDLPYNWHTQLW